MTDKNIMAHAHSIDNHDTTHKFYPDSTIILQETSPMHSWMWQTVSVPISCTTMSWVGRNLIFIYDFTQLGVWECTWTAKNPLHFCILSCLELYYITLTWWPLSEFKTCKNTSLMQVWYYTWGKAHVICFLFCFSSFLNLKKRKYSLCFMDRTSHTTHPTFSNYCQSCHLMIPLFGSMPQPHWKDCKACVTLSIMTSTNGSLYYI